MFKETVILTADSERHILSHLPMWTSEEYLHNKLRLLYFTVSGKHYEWRLFVGHQWLPVDNDHVIETHYCHPGAKGITINTSHGSVM